MTRVFLISIYSLVALASLMLSIAEELPLPTGLTVPLAAIAFHQNEVRRNIRLRTVWANALGLGAFGVAGLELLLAGYAGDGGGAAELRVLAGAHLLTYLTWVALFQTKEGRQYWWIMGLSVMQVAVGSILTQSGLFGGLLILYVFFALWTLSVYSLYQARFAFENAGGITADLAIETAGPGRHLADSGMMLAHHKADEVHGGIQLDLNEKWVNARFIGGVLSTACLSLAVGLTFFVMIPRLWVGGRHHFGNSRDSPIRTVTGFTDEVQLGEIGQILSSTAPVFEVRFSDSRNAEELSVETTASELGYTEPLFRGSVMGQYDNGRWHVLEETRNVTPLLEPQPSFQRKRIRQHYILHGTSSKSLFGMHPINRAELNEKFVPPAMDVVSSILMRADDQSSLDRETEYVLYGYIPRDPSRRPRVAEVYNERAGRIRASVQHKYLTMPDGLQRLSSLSHEIVGITPGESLPAVRHLQATSAIEVYLRDHGGLSYSLNASVTDQEIDPVEDFLFNRKEGHCEYFASAMALMLRAAGIPSRLVSGFKGGEQSTISGAFVVQDRHAHAWAEAWVNGRWQTYDPTPADARAASVEEIGAGRNVVASFRELFTGFWNQRVVRMSYDEQRRSLYEPLGVWAKAKLQQLTRPFGESGRRLVDFLSNPRQWFSLETFIGTAILCVSVVGLRRLWRWFRPEGSVPLRDVILQFLKRLIRRLFSSPERERIEFYERFTTILARSGLRRRPHETPREFALAVEVQLQELLSDRGLDSFPDDLAGFFYQVRYGQQALSHSDRSMIDSRLTLLSEVLYQVRVRNGHSSSVPERTMSLPENRAD